MFKMLESWVFWAFMIFFVCMGAMLLASSTRLF